MPRLKSRAILSILAAILVLFVIYSGFGKFANETDYLKGLKFDHQSTDFKPIVGQNTDNDPRHYFWNHIFDIFDQGRPNITDVGSAIEYVDASRNMPNSKTVLLSRANISPETKDELKTKHDIVKSKIHKTLAQETYESKTNGIVLIGGGRFSWLSYLSLSSLRKAGSSLPVEIIMPQHDDFVKEQHFCVNVLPKLNAKCVVLPDILGAHVMNEWGKDFANYQFKSLALMVSSFQNVLLLDSDNIVVQNPDVLFESKLFKDHGMVTWPDYWERTISPVFYEISGAIVNEEKRVRYNRFPLAVDNSQGSHTVGNSDSEVPFHDLEGSIPNLSTESGQLLINKQTHTCTLLLSMYYNMLGPNIYYKLLSLGQQGEGDKDTFPAAATVCKESFYQVKSFIKTFGYIDADGNFQGVAMGQKNPLLDFEKYDNLVYGPSKSKEMKALSIDEQISKLKELESSEFGQTSGSLFTVHCNYPKLDPLVLMSRDDLFDANSMRLRYRIYGGLTFDDPNIRAKTLDFEYEQWKSIENILCNEGIEFVHFKDQNLEYVCSFIRSEIKFLTQNPVEAK